MGEALAQAERGTMCCRWSLGGRRSTLRHCQDGACTMRAGGVYRV